MGLPPTSSVKMPGRRVAINWKTLCLMLALACYFPVYPAVILFVCPLSDIESKSIGSTRPSRPVYQGCGDFLPPALVIFRHGGSASHCQTLQPPRVYSGSTGTHVCGGKDRARRR